MLTNNEVKLLRLLMVNSDSDYSINQIAKELNLSPNGAYKILKKLENEEILVKKNIANIKSFRINFKSEKTTNILELALMSKLDKKLKLRLEDFKEIKKVTKACIIFGSYLTKKNPNDLDVLFILDKNNFKEYSKQLNEIQEISPVRVHDVIQTESDLKGNIKNKTPVILVILKEGIVLYGHKILIKIIKDVYKK